MPVRNRKFNELEKLVDKKSRDWLTKLVIIGRDRAVVNITTLGRVQDNIMRGQMTWEVHPNGHIGRYGNNVYYTEFQEFGTLNADGSQRIAPGFFMRDALMYVKSRANKVRL